MLDISNHLISILAGRAPLRAVTTSSIHDRLDIQQRPLQRDRGGVRVCDASTFHVLQSSCSHTPFPHHSRFDIRRSRRRDAFEKRPSSLQLVAENRGKQSNVHNVFDSPTTLSGWTDAAGRAERVRVSAMVSGRCGALPMPAFRYPMSHGMSRPPASTAARSDVARARAAVHADVPRARR